MRDEPWFEALARLPRRGAASLAGTCAGAILLAREVRPRQPSLGLLDAVIERNAFGRQVDSFEATVDAPALGGPLDAVFIRAPRFRALFPEVEVLGRYAGEPVLVRQGRVRGRHVPPRAHRLARAAPLPRRARRAARARGRGRGRSGVLADRPRHRSSSDGASASGTATGHWKQSP